MNNMATMRIFDVICDQFSKEQNNHHSSDRPTILGRLTCSKHLSVTARSIQNAKLQRMQWKLFVFEYGP
jgi:hypothetical protein